DLTEAIDAMVPEGDQFCIERSASLRIEGQGEVRGHFEVSLHRLPRLYPDERFAVGQGRPEIAEGLEDERPQRRGIAHADTASPAPPRTASLVSLTGSSCARARTRRTPRG